MQNFTGQFYINEKTFALGSQILFPALKIKEIAGLVFRQFLDLRGNLGNVK